MIRSIKLINNNIFLYLIYIIIKKIIQLFSLQKKLILLFYIPTYINYIIFILYYI